MTQESSNFGLVGLAVMGQNLALNIADHGFQISVYNRTFSKTAQFLEQNSYSSNLFGFETLESFVHSIQKPRKIIIMVQAGSATDAVIDSLMPYLDEKDIIIDGGNAKWTDTIRREKLLHEHNIYFIGSGVSGGEEGARFGPSLMAGGSSDAWAQIKDTWLSISAKVDSASGKPIEGGSPGNPVMGGVPCAAYIGENGSGHYVKMVHNGIEYGDMQMILDAAGQKGTGKWTSVNALDMGTPAPTVAEAVFARCMSAIKDERVHASSILSGPDKKISNEIDKNIFLESIRGALYCSKICSYAQGFQLMQTAATEYGWSLNFGEIAQIWRGGCIIRADFLQKITEAYEKDNHLPNLLLDDYFRCSIEKYQANWRYVISIAVLHGVPVPTFSSALSYYDSYRAKNLPQNLLQLQRDYFGAHTYERTDKPRGEHFHLDWLDTNRPELKV
jgi:6-phosphogluconate dehydrogenase